MTETADAINTATKKLNSRIKQKPVFDPRVLTDDGKSRVIWNTESVNLAENGIREGYKLKEYPFLKTVKGVNLRKANLPFKYSDEELEIMSVVIDDKIFFGNNFAKLKDADKGWRNITLRDYQETLLHKYTKNPWNIVMFPRQSGKTTTTVIEIVHFAISNIDKDIVVIAQSDKVVNEILSKIKECFAGLPFFMQPGFVSFTKKGFVLDNGCRLTIGIAAESVVQGFSLDLVFIDEFAYIKNGVINQFWTNIYPTMSNNPNSRCIIASTPNGRNLFYQLWIGAESGANRFTTSRIYWWEVPGRDEQFKLDTIANMGLEGWEIGYNLSFDTHLKSIFHVTTQKYLRDRQLTYKAEWSKNNHQLGNKFDIEFINQNIIPYDLKKDYFVMGIDLGEGLEQDNTVLKIRKIEWCKIKKCLVYKSVGIYKSNTIAVEDFAEYVMELLEHFDKNKIRVVVENNTYGGEFFSQIKSLKMFDSRFSLFDNVVFAKFYRNSKDDFEYGIRWDGGNKKLAVKSFNKLISNKIMDETNESTIEEYLNFGRMKNNTYAAQYGKDDQVMADVTISHFIKSNTIYSIEFLKEVETNLREICNDVDEEIIKKREEEERRKNNIYKHNDFTLRNHVEHVKDEIDDIYFVGLN